MTWWVSAEFSINLLLSDCYQVTYIQFLRCGASDDCPGVLILYVFISQNRSWELSQTILTDDRRKVTTAPDRDDF